MTCGSILGAAMLLMWSASSAKPILYAAWTGLGAAQAMTFYDAGFAALTRRLGGSAPRAILRMPLLGGFAGPVFITLTGWLAATCGWRGALMLPAGIHPLHPAPPPLLGLPGARGGHVRASCV